MGICKDRSILLKINTVNGRPLHDYAIIGNGYYIFMPTREMIDVLSNNSKVIEKYYTITNYRNIRGYDYIRIYLPSKFTNALYSTRKSLTILLDTWEYPVLSCDFQGVWGRDDLSEEEINNTIDTTASINFGLINDVEVLDKMIKYPEKSWINEYIDKLTEIL
jgi:hypothetical protein